MFFINFKFYNYCTHILFTINNKQQMKIIKKQLNKKKIFHRVTKKNRNQRNRHTFLNIIFMQKIKIKLIITKKN